MTKSNFLYPVQAAAFVTWHVKNLNTGPIGGHHRPNLLAISVMSFKTINRGIVDAQQKINIVNQWEPNTNLRKGNTKLNSFRTILINLPQTLHKYCKG